MSNDLRARLHAAATCGEIVSIIYHRGSQPGAVRDIVPLAITDDEVRARDIASKMDKTFKLAHLELAGAASAASKRYDPDVAAIDGTSLHLAFEPHVAALQALGWHVELAPDCVSLHGFFKNGKLRKGSTVALLFREWSIEPLDDGEWQEPGVKSTRPYYLASPSFERARTFAHLSPAMSVFLEEAQKHAPP
jgi:hypothetical protein